MGPHYVGYKMTHECTCIAVMGEGQTGIRSLVEVLFAGKFNKDFVPCCMSQDPHTAVWAFEIEEKIYSFRVEKAGGHGGEEYASLRNLVLQQNNVDAITVCFDVNKKDMSHTRMLCAEGAKHGKKMFLAGLKADLRRPR